MAQILRNLIFKDPWPVQKNNLFQFRNRPFLVFVFACWFGSCIRLEKFPFLFDFDHSVEIMDGVNFLAFTDGFKLDTHFGYHPN